MMFHTLKALIVLLLFVGLDDLRVNADDLPWITMYLPSYYQDESGFLIVQLGEEDYKKITHLSHHGPYVNRDGSFNYTPTRYSDLKGEQAVRTAHSHHIPILLCIVSWKEYLFTVKNQTSRTNLVQNTVHLMDRVGYDGVDVDLEPVIHPGIPEIAHDYQDYVLFIKELSDSLRVRESSFLGRKPLLTTAVNGIAGMALAQIHDRYDQINLMTYDMSQPWPGWPVWHDAAIYDGRYPFPDVGDLHSSSVELDVKKCTDHGIPRSKIGIGVSGDAFQWRGGTGTPEGGATEPLQYVWNAPAWKRFGYKDMMKNHYKPEYYRWDDGAKMSYLSIDYPGSEKDEFWSFNDKRSCFEKMNYVKNNSLGGVIIWEIGNAYIRDAPDENHLPILDALYRAKRNEDYPATFNLLVNNGTGSGRYEPGTTIKISAAGSYGKRFSHWTGDVTPVEHVKSAVTLLKMPEMDITVTAFYLDTVNE